jgi:hypothetical protein
MFVTIDVLESRGACKEGIAYIERFFPEGAEMVDIIRARHISKEFLHWGREHLDPTESDIEAYCEVCNIVNTKNHWYSVNVSDSDRVVKSSDVHGSYGVFGSTSIKDSFDVVASDSIENSKQIFHSEMIEASTRIFKSKNVVDSNNIINSTGVTISKNVIDSFGVFGSTEIISSEKITNSHFCKNCKNIKHCLFCENLENAEYHIFNQPVEKEWYEQFVRQYEKYQTAELSFVREWPEELVANITVIPTKKYDDWYSQIPEKFWKWAATLPGYDEMFMYDMTMCSNILLG